MDADSRWLVIVNPASGRPDGGAGWRAIEAALRDAGVAFETIHTERPGHGEELARNALQRGRRRIAAAGGDGSVNEVVHGIMRAGVADTRDVTLAVVPTGTGNDWARSLGITRAAGHIAGVLARGRTMLHDVGAIDFPDTGGPRCWFINVAGAGYDAAVTERVPRPVPSARKPSDSEKVTSLKKAFDDATCAPTSAACASRCRLQKSISRPRCCGIFPPSCGKTTGRCGLPCVAAKSAPFCPPWSPTLTMRGDISQYGCSSARWPCGRHWPTWTTAKPGSCPWPPRPSSPTASATASLSDCR